MACKDIYFSKGNLKKNKKKTKARFYIWLEVVEMKQNSLPENWEWYSQNDILN